LLAGYFHKNKKSSSPGRKMNPRNTQGAGCGFTLRGKMRDKLTCDVGLSPRPGNVKNLERGKTTWSAPKRVGGPGPNTQSVRKGVWGGTKENRGGTRQVPVKKRKNQEVRPLRIMHIICWKGTGKGALPHKGT